MISNLVQPRVGLRCSGPGGTSRHGHRRSARTICTECSVRERLARSVRPFAACGPGAVWQHIRRPSSPATFGAP
eukprot:13205502-Alexandrium_andersonii.AAC.1